MDLFKIIPISYDPVQKYSLKGIQKYKYEVQWMGSSNLWVQDD